MSAAAAHRSIMEILRINKDATIRLQCIGGALHEGTVADINSDRVKLLVSYHQFNAGTSAGMIERPAMIILDHVQSVEEMV